jgi:hypothetical protein
MINNVQAEKKKFGMLKQGQRAAPWDLDPSQTHLVEQAKRGKYIED